MTNADGIAAAAARHREAHETLRAAFAPMASDADDRAALDRYMDIRARLPCPEHLRDDWMAEAHGGLSKSVEAIQGRLHARAVERRRLGGLADDTHARALRAMGRHWGGLIAARVGGDPATLVMPLVDEAYFEASEFRSRHIDGLLLAYDPEGPFTRALHEAIAVAKGMPTKGPAWLRNVVDCLGQVAFADVACPPGRVAVLRAAGLDPADVGGPAVDGRARVTVRIRPADIRATLGLFASYPGTFEVTGPFVTDPHFRFPRAEATADAVVARPLENLDEAELAGRTAALTWESAAGHGAAARRAASLLAEVGRTSSRPF